MGVGVGVAATTNQLSATCNLLPSPPLLPLLLHHKESTSSELTDASDVGDDEDIDYDVSPKTSWTGHQPWVP